MTAISIAVAGMGAVFILVPFFWMVSTSLKTPPQIATFPPVWIPDPFDWHNYVEAMTVLPFGRFALNTVIITVLGVVGIVLTGSISAFAFARLNWPGREFWFFALLSGLFLPGPVTLIPKFILFRHLGWVNTYLPLVAPYYFGGNAFTIFLLRQFFRGISPEVDDAARIDGCSTFGIYWRILLPLSKPALGITAIFGFQHIWNDFFEPLIYLNSREKYTMSLGLQLFKGEFDTQWDLLMAASLVTMMPLIIVFFFAQRYYVQGIVFTGIKG